VEEEKAAGEEKKEVGILRGEFEDCESIQLCAKRIEERLQMQLEWKVHK
jgi:hypothetical protein